MYNITHSCSLLTLKIYQSNPFLVNLEWKEKVSKELNQSERRVIEKTLVEDDPGK